MKLPHFGSLRAEVRSLNVQVVLELIAGALFTAFFLRWLM